MVVGVKVFVEGRSVFMEDDLPECFVASRLEAVNGSPEMERHFFRNEENAMKVIRHHLKQDDLNLWMKGMDVIPAMGDGMAKRCQLDMRIVFRG